jgi:LmbE family N-acetylglucosaminyl deacetylase
VGAGFDPIVELGSTIRAMSTLVCFHAHPDDEAIGTGGLMAKAAALGHRVVLVTATNGEHGEPQPGVLADGESLKDRRLVEVAESAAILGAELVLLGYQDSGMVGTPENDNPDCFWQTDVDAAAERLAAILREVDADVLTIYDDHGLYGHPDHIQVHRVGRRAAELAGVEHVYEGTVNRDRARVGFAALREQMPADPDALEAEFTEAEFTEEEFETFGMLEKDLAYELDIRDFIDTKREALKCHRSQVSPDDFFLSMPPDAFAAMFGVESYSIPGVTDTGGPQAVDMLPGL